jgi:hypothetical protein
LARISTSFQGVRRSRSGQILIDQVQFVFANLL